MTEDQAKDRFKTMVDDIDQRGIPEPMRSVMISTLARTIADQVKYENLMSAIREDK